jgi:hypothetical protein
MKISLALMLMGLAASPAAASEPNLLENSSAEARALTGWETDGFQVARYGETSGVPPAVMPQLASTFGLRLMVPPFGERLFVATRAGAALSQVVHLAGQRQLAAFAWLGAPPDAAGGVRLDLQPLDGTGRALGDPWSAGPPARGDLVDDFVPLLCGVNGTLPEGTWAARITLTATAPQVFADALMVSDEPLGMRRIQLGPKIETPNCTRYIGPLTPTRLANVKLRGRSLSLVASSDARLRVRVERLTRGRVSGQAVRPRTWYVRRGRSVLRIPRRLGRGVYRVTLLLPDRGATLSVRRRL